MRKYTLEEAISIFWSRVQKSENDDECWNWIARIGDKGYGKFWFRKSMRNAHCVSWELTNGKIPKGLFVCHKCDNRRCCNPSHLFLGTHLENMQDMINKRRNPRGEAQGHHVLTWEQVHAIRARYAQGGVTHRALAREYGIGNTTIFNVLNGYTWKEEA